MTTAARTMYGTAAALAALLLGAALPSPARAQQPSAPPGAATAQSSAELIARGKYLADMGDCEACHTAPNGPHFAGGLLMDTPFGKIPTPNITPDKATGIGKYTDAQFIRVFRHGIRRDGQNLYPVMPFPWYTKVTDSDILAIKAYLFSLPPVHAPHLPLEVSFPFNIRSAIAVWDTVFLQPGVFKPDPHASAQVNRGAYIVEGLEHCGECHDKRNLLGAGAISRPLQGGEIDHWYAPDITSDVRTGIGRYSDDQLFTFLKTGTAPGMGTVVGPMSQTQHDSLSKLTDDDIHAIVAYLRSTPAKPGFTPSVPVGMSEATLPGAQVYLNNCASCHQVDGKGVGTEIPSLVANGVVKSGGPESVIRVILGGVEAQGTYGPMPAVGNFLTDQQIADVANYVRSAWGNNAPATVGPGEVGTLRNEAKTYLSGRLPGECPTVVQPTMAKIVAQPDVQTLLRNTTIENLLQNANALIAKVKATDPHIAQADVVNSLTIAYCPILMHNPSLSESDKLSELNTFDERVYTQIDHGERD